MLYSERRTNPHGGRTNAGGGCLQYKSTGASPEKEGEERGMRHITPPHRILKILTTASERKSQNHRAAQSLGHATNSKNQASNSMFDYYENQEIHAHGIYVGSWVHPTMQSDPSRNSALLVKGGKRRAAYAHAERGRDAAWRRRPDEASLSLLHAPGSSSFSSSLLGTFYRPGPAAASAPLRFLLSFHP